MSIWNWLRRRGEPAGPNRPPPDHAVALEEEARRNTEADQRRLEALRRIAADRQEAKHRAEQAALERRAWLASAGHLLDGTWEVVSAVIDGEARPDVVGDELVFAGEWVHFGPKYPLSEGGFRQDLGALPSRVMFQAHNPSFVPEYFRVGFEKVVGPELAPDVEIITTRHLAIYELAGDELRLCGMGADGQWPVAFDAPAGTGRYLLIYQRVGPPSPPVRPDAELVAAPDPARE